MARQCTICGRGALVGNNVSHANNKTKRKSQVNLQRVKIKAGKLTKRARVCTRCIRSGRVEKAA